jgi:hypothetical protein
MRTFLFAIFLLAAFAFTIPASAQIFYQDIVPDKTMSSWDATDIRIDTTIAGTPAYGSPRNLTIWEEFGAQIVVNAFSDCEVMTSGGYPAALAPNEAIGPAGTWTQPNYAVLNNGAQGNWRGVTDRYLGVRVKSGAQWLYGWIRMDVNTAGSSVTIKDYACNKTGGAPLLAGQTTTAVDAVPTANGISLFPHPVATAALISSDKTFIDATVTLRDLCGRVVLSTAGHGGYTLSLTRGDLPAGVYLLRVTEDGVPVLARLVVLAE